MILTASNWSTDTLTNEEMGSSCEMNFLLENERYSNISEFEEVQSFLKMKGIQTSQNLKKSSLLYTTSKKKKKKVVKNITTVNCKIIKERKKERSLWRWQGRAQHLKKLEAALETNPQEMLFSKLQNNVILLASSR